MNTAQTLLIIQRRIGYVKPANQLVVKFMETKVTEEDRKNHKELTNSCRMEFQQCYDYLRWDAGVKYSETFEPSDLGDWGYPTPKRIRVGVKYRLGEVDCGTRIHVGMIKKNEGWEEGTGAFICEFAYDMMLKNDYEGKIL
jgi:hypothetical protein